MRQPGANEALQPGGFGERQPGGADIRQPATMKGPNDDADS